MHAQHVLSYHINWTMVYIPTWLSNFLGKLFLVRLKAITDHFPWMSYHTGRVRNNFLFSQIMKLQSVGIWRHLVTSKESSNPILLFGKRPCLHHTCATWNEQPASIKTMKLLHKLGQDFLDITWKEYLLKSYLQT